jgi:membrane protein
MGAGPTSGISHEPKPAAPAGGVPPKLAVIQPGSLEWFRAQAVPTAKYLLQTEVHTFAFSVAANAILSFFPFIVLMLTVTRQVLHSNAMYDVVIQLLRDHLPTGQEFVTHSLVSMAASHRGVKIASLIILLITSTGVFVPLEVALNKVWRIEKNRSYLSNQIISIVLAFGCGALGLVSVALTAGNQLMLRAVFGSHADSNFLLKAVAYLIMKVCAVFASIAIFFLIYWLLPNGKIKASAVMPSAIAIGILWEVGKYLYILALPWLDFQNVYGPFAISVTLMFWAFLSGLLLLAGAYLSAATPKAGNRAAKCALSRPRGCKPLP